MGKLSLALRAGGYGLRHLTALALCLLLLITLAAHLALPSFLPAYHPPTLVLMAMLSALVVAVVGALFHWLVSRPLYLLEREVHILLSANPAHSLELSGPHMLGALPEAIAGLGTDLYRARREIAEAVRSRVSSLEDSKSHLETVLMALGEGVLVCDAQGRLLFYNPAAKGVFRDSPALGLGRSLYLLCSEAPVQSALAVLRQRKLRHREVQAGQEQEDASIVIASLEGGLIACRLRLLPEVPGLAWSFMMTCRDISREADARGRRDNLLRAAVRGMRGPLTGLSLSLEGLQSVPDLRAQDRAALTRTMEEETRNLVARFEVLAHEVEETEAPRYTANDIYTEDLIACAARDLEALGLRLTMAGDPLWVRADLQALLGLLVFFALKLKAEAGVEALEVETLLGDKRVYFDYYWRGHAISQGELARWCTEPLAPGQGALTAAEALERHASDVWSRDHEAPGYAMLRFPMPTSTSQWEPQRPALPSRPVYIESAIEEAAPEALGWADRSLASLSYLVFDTETTGLSPMEGDEVVSLAGVKIVNRGIILGETFDRLVDPGRPIPEASVRFHGITDGMVKGKPTLEAALRDFRAFAEGAVLVGHNVAFDMQFLKRRAPRAGVRLDLPVLDTLGLSLYLHGHTPEHSLDSIARRLGVEVRNRHTALGDSLITAQVFLKFLYLLEERGIKTLKAAWEVSHR